MRRRRLDVWEDVATTLETVGRCTLQKSMLFTPLLPSAGPTGGEGDACPAPTISLTIWSFAIAFRAMVGGDVVVVLGWVLGNLRRWARRCRSQGFPGYGEVFD
jgi:hypothetical protein